MWMVAAGEPADVGEQVCLGVVGKVVGPADRQRGSTVTSASARRVWPIQRIRSSRTPVTPSTVSDRGAGLVDQGRVDGVHQPGSDLPDRGAQHAQDRDRDQQPDDRVGPPPADRDTACTQQRRPGW